MENAQNNGHTDRAPRPAMAGTEGASLRRGVVHVWSRRDAVRLSSLRMLSPVIRMLLISLPCLSSQVLLTASAFCQVLAVSLINGAWWTKPAPQWGRWHRLQGEDGVQLGLQNWHPVFLTGHWWGNTS